MLAGVLACNSEINVDYLAEVAPEIEAKVIIDPAPTVITDQVAPSAPFDFVATKGSSSSITLNWTSAGGTTTEFQISYNDDGSLPLDCAIADNLITLSGTSKEIIGLTSNQQYQFKLCSLNGNTIPDLSAPIVIDETTFATCDYSLTSMWLDDSANGYGDDSMTDDFDEFEVFLHAISDQNADGIISVCLADGVSITTTSITSGDRIFINNVDNLHIYAETGDTASLINNRTDGAVDYFNDHGVFHINSNSDSVSLSNLTLHSEGDEGRVIYNNYGGSYTVLEDLTITAIGSHSEGIHFRDGAVGLIKNVSIITDDNLAYGLEMQSDVVITKIDGLSIFTQGPNSPAIEASVNSSGIIMEMINSSFKTVGSASHGIRLGDNGAVLKMDNVSFVRSNLASTNASAMFFNDNSVYVNTSDIVNTIVCTESGGTSWEYLLQDATNAEYTAGTNEYLNSPGPFGAQTFPWGDTTNVGNAPWNVQQQWGGTCSL
jgi:hypothetical protein